MRTGTFVILANAKWDSGGMGGNSSQQFARTLRKLGWDVSYVAPSGRWKFKDPDSIRDVDDTIVMCDFPYVEAYKDLFDRLAACGCRTVCRIVDHWQSIDVHKDFNPELEAEFLKTADAVFASSPLNVERLRESRPDIRLLRNGVDLDRFHFVPSESRSDLRPNGMTLGVVASFWIKRWIRLEPLLRYARRHAEDHIQIVGTKERMFQFSFPPNIIFHGPVPWSELPPVIHQFDVCVVPYERYQTRYTNPIKALEYLACGKPVISCFNDSIAAYPYVYFYNHARDFEDAVRKAAGTPINRDVLWTFLKNQTWEERVRTILRTLETMKARAPTRGSF